MIVIEAIDKLFTYPQDAILVIGGAEVIGFIVQTTGGLTTVEPITS